MKRNSKIYVLLLTLVFCTSCKGQVKTDLQKDNNNSETQSVITAAAPDNITRNIIQDRRGNVWIASWGGVYKYDGKSFTNITNKISSARFFSVLEDRKGNLWFGSIGSGVYYYDGRSFRNFTTKDGLLNNEITCIYEDKAGNIWFGTGGGASRYDGTSFRNYIINKNTMNEDPTGKTFQDRPPYEVTSIIQDKAGKFWFATRGNTFVYDGKTFAVFTHNGKPFTNVRSVIEDKKGNVWLGGYNGLWRYDGRTFTNFTQKFVGYVYEDKKGNIWISSEGINDLSKVLIGYSANTKAWALSRYDEKSLSDKNPTVTEITNKPMTFGIFEDNKGNIWFGAFDGVYRYDGNTVTDFKNKENRK
ncbi:histidine kinase [Mucilaginibacter sp. SMC90]|uniref:ligand-binding sensor domain-containing protein n=1 Tax=Mucilaginibacter sp. SMC90 TaxID=2929803 RepID=UPI001FB4220B|nr:two-component regulator propeller domain-containing protein [Mucilaginibacter sp. SMC90]UOE46555.1 histidine kinase [Mucilaginibacter sp. SMC90]